MMGNSSLTTLSPIEHAILVKICSREAQRQQFRQESYCRVEATLKPGRMDAFTILLWQIKSQINPLLQEPVAQAVILDLKEQSFSLRLFEKTDEPRPAAMPVTLAEMVLCAAAKWHWSPAQTRTCIDELHNLSGPLIQTGLNIEMIEETRLRILSDYGKDYLPPKPRRLSSTINRQNILTPVNVDKTPKKIKRILSPEQHKVYHLIWSRFLAWQTKDAIIQEVNIEVTAGENKRYLFKRQDQGIIFRGYMQVLEQEGDFELRNASYVWDSIMRKGEPLRLVKFALIKEKTQPPAHICMDALCNAKGGDRSETQMALAHLLAGQYLYLNGDGLEPTDKGIVLAGTDGTPVRARERDENQETVHSGKAAKDKLAPKERAAARMTCPLCGNRLVARQGRYGRFLACAGYPACRHTQPVALDIPCPVEGCEGYLVERRTAKGKLFYGCSAYPNCQHMQWQVT